MELSAIGEKSVSFKAVTEGGMATLAYSNPEPDAFHIDITLKDGNAFTIKLAAR